MQRSTKTLLLLCGTTLVVGGGFVGYRLTSKVLKNDPIAPYRKADPNEIPKEVAILMKETEFKRIENGKPSASCFVQEMKIANNRQVYDLEGIRNGKLTWKNAVYKFEATKGNWNGFSKMLNISGKMRLIGPNFDLTSPQMGYDETRRTLDLPQPVAGIAYGGKLTVARFTYDMDLGTYEGGKGNWTGKLPQEVKKQAPEVKSGRTWSFDFENVKKSKENPNLVTYTDAKATDGEIIVVAPLITHDEKSDVLTATKNVRYYSPKANVIADKIVVYRKEKRSVLSGNVSMFVKPKSKENDKAQIETLTPMIPIVPESIASQRPTSPENEEARKKQEEQIRSGKNLRDYPMTVTASQIEYWYKKGERRAKITGKPQARQELPDNAWRYIWSSSALYDGEKDLLTLESAKGAQDVILKNSLGDELHGTWGQLSTKEGEDDYEFRKGNAKMSSRDDDEDLPPPQKKSGGGGNIGGGISGRIGT
jgi:hypothetical protein